MDLGRTARVREKLATVHGGGWTGDASTGFVKSLGILELLATVGLLLPAALGTYLSTQADAENTARTQKAAQFQELRPLLFSITYRALGTVTEIDVLRSARIRRETYADPWLPEPLLTDPYEDPARAAELADSVSLAALLFLERLTPLERAVFVLREVFDFPFPEVAEAVGRSESVCRQLAVRARRHMSAATRASRRPAPRATSSRRVSSRRCATVMSWACEGCWRPA